MSDLVIVESPAKAKTIEKILGKGYTVKASVGHVKDLPPRRLGVDIQDGFVPEYIVIRGKAKILEELRKSAKRAEKIYLAPDPDREGEAIAWHIASELEGKNREEIYRVLFNEITPRAIREAMRHPGRIDESKVNAQQARRILDRLVGYQISPLLWRKVRRGLSAGRVQSVALRLICDREKEIEAFVPVEYWTVTVVLEGEQPPPFEAQLVKIGKARLDDLQPGDGVIQIVPRAFGAATAAVVAGADEAGAEAAAFHLARRVPFLWDTGRGAPSLQDLKTDAARFFQARSGAGQAGLALAELEAVLKPLRGRMVESFDAKLFLEAADPQAAGFFAGVIRQTLPSAQVTVAAQGITDPVPVFEEKIQVPWEVDEFWSRFRAEVLPKVSAGARVDVEARLSESPNVRQALAEQVRAELTKAGAASLQVRVLSAYKQGFLWLTEQVMPALKGKGARSVRIAVAAHRPDLAKKYKFYQVPSRWLHELYPVDELFQRDLGIPRESFHLELVDDGGERCRLDNLQIGNPEPLSHHEGRRPHHGGHKLAVAARRGLDPARHLRLEPHALHQRDRHRADGRRVGD